jgi:hypothetical protein
MQAPCIRPFDIAPLLTCLRGHPPKGRVKDLLPGSFSSVSPNAQSGAIFKKTKEPFRASPRALVLLACIPIFFNKLADNSDNTDSS